MTTVPPPNPGLPQMLAAATANQPTATVTAPPPAIAALPPGTTLEGTITPSPDPRVTLLATAAGEVALRTPLPLPEGATLTVEVVRASPAQVTVRLIALDGQALQQALPNLTRPPLDAPPPATQPLPTTLPTAPGVAAPLPQGFAFWPGAPQPVTVVPTGVVVPVALNTAVATSGGGNVPATPPNAVTPTPTTAAAPVSTPAPTVPAPPTPSPVVLSTGADLAIRITGITLPMPGTGIAATVPNATPGNAVLPPVAAPIAPNVVPQSLPLLPPSTPIITQSPTALVPGPTLATPETTPGLVLPRSEGWAAAAPQPPAGVQSAMPAAIVTATVISLTDGVPTVRIGDADVQLNIRANLPPGTTLTLELQGQQPATLPITAAPLTPPAAAPLSVAQPGWPALSQAIDLLEQTDPMAARQLTNAIPDGGARTAAAMMSFAQAMRTGESRQWPGDTTLRALEKAGPRGAHLAGQIAAEVADLGRQVRDTGAEWRTVPMPWNNDGRIERVRLLTREVNPDADAEKKRSGGGTRFLIDLSLSRLGALQVDGMFRKENRQFDVMIRTKAALPETMQRDLAGIFASSNAAMNLVGSLNFQVVKKFPDPSTLRVGQDKSGLWV
jgi:hypothetical protein